MITEVYSVQDVLTGFAQPFCFDNEQIAKRCYEDFLKTDKHPEDKRLFKIGQFNTETGELTSEVPECIQGGGEKNESEIQK